METAYDWITVFIFAGLVTRFLQQSTVAETEDASLWHYLLAATGCAAVNWLGNESHHLFALLLLAGVMAYTAYFILGMGRKGTGH